MRMIFWYYVYVITVCFIDLEKEQYNEVSNGEKIFIYECKRHEYEHFLNEECFKKNFHHKPL